MKFKQGTGLWIEDHVNDFNANRYLSARSTLRWYYKMERQMVRRNLNSRRAMQSAHNNSGLHHSGQGAFERELKRQAIEPEKYPLTSTTGAKRVAELVLLRRMELEKKSKVAMDMQRTEKSRAEPSEWYDERLGPLNPHFLKSIQSNYSTNIVQLPDEPYIRTKV